MDRNTTATTTTRQSQHCQKTRVRSGVESPSACASNSDICALFCKPPSPSGGRLHSSATATTQPSGLCAMKPERSASAALFARNPKCPNHHPHRQLPAAIGAVQTNRPEQATPLAWAVSPLDTATMTVVGNGGFRAEARQVFQNLQAVAEAGRRHAADIVNSTRYAEKPRKVRRTQKTHNGIDKRHITQTRLRVSTKRTLPKGAADQSRSRPRLKRIIAPSAPHFEP